MRHFTLSLLAGAAVLSMAAAVQAADLIIDEPAMTAGVVDVGGRWEGIYVGAFGGYTAGAFNDDIDGIWFDNGDEINVSGWLLGLNAGANFYLTDGVVGGIVGDVAWSDATGSLSDIIAFQYDINWQGSLRAKLGFDAGAFMPYLTGGLAVANGTFLFFDGSDSQTHIGWTVGAGVEVAVTDDLSIDALYRYSDYGSATYFDTSPDISLNTHQVTVGLNWKF